MNFVQQYGNWIEKQGDRHPLYARNLITAGLQMELFRTRFLQNKDMPKAYQELNSFAVKRTLNAFRHPSSAAWVNLFSPVELLECFDLNCLSMEGLSSFMAGFTCEDYLIDRAESTGITSTLCSYHKNFMGLLDTGIAPKAAFATTTSMLCDGNVQSFRYIQNKQKLPTYLIDTPSSISEDSILYVKNQISEMIPLLEQATGKSFDIDRLREVLKRENQSKEYYRLFLKELQTRYYPSTLTLQMYMIFASHLAIGTPEVLNFYKHMYEDIQTYPDFSGKRIFWIHLLPFYQPCLQQYFNYSHQLQIQAMDMNLDYMDPLDLADPLQALATKIICNMYNGPYDNKIDSAIRYAKELHSDGVIQFCHWGCKQSSGGVMLMKAAMKDAGIPMLILDGDGIDRRNSHNGQIRTRLEAFLEVIS